MGSTDMDSFQHGGTFRQDGSRHETGRDGAGDYGSGSYAPYLNGDDSNGGDRGASRAVEAVLRSMLFRGQAGGDGMRRRGASAQVGLPRVPLVRAVSAAVVPRLVLAHRGPAPAQRKGMSAEAPPQPDPAALAPFVPILAGMAVRSDLEGAVALIEARHADGHALDCLYLVLISGAARHLGALWHADQASFADVTIGILLLQRLLHALDHAFCGEVVRREPGRRILLVPRPGEAHGFAIDVLGAFLRRAGWDVTSLMPTTDQALCGMVHAGWYAVLGISDSCGEHCDRLSASISAARRAACNREMCVMVGGPVFAADPELALRVGADATAVDASHAVTQAEGLFSLLNRAG